MQSLLCDELGLGLDSLLDFLAVGDNFGEDIAEDDTLSAGLVEGAIGLRVKIPIAKATMTKAPPIPMPRKIL